MPRVAMGIRTLVIVYDISQVVSAAVVRLSHAHGVVREVDIAVIACDATSLVRTLLCLRGGGRRLSSRRRRGGGEQHTKDYSADAGEC